MKHATNKRTFLKTLLKNNNKKTKIHSDLKRMDILKFQNIPLLRSPLKKGHSLCVLVCNRATTVTPKKALFDVIFLLGDLVIAYWTTFVVIVLIHDQCPVHIRVLTMFTRIFRVKGGGLFKATSFCFLTVVLFHCPFRSLWVPSASLPFSEATSSSSSSSTCSP